MALPHWFIEIIKKAFPQRFLLAKLTRIPFIKYIVNKLFFEDDVIYYLPKESVLQNKHKIIQKITVNKKIPKLDDILLPSQIIDTFIEKASYIWKMNFCICREANDCQTYSKQLGCLFMGESAKKINPAYGKELTKDEAKQYIKKCSSEGLVQLIGKNKIDAQWLDAKPGDKLLTICNCCECCCLWKMLPDLDIKISRNVSKMPGIQVKVTDNCSGCGICVDRHCFVNAISLVNNKAQIDQTLCRGCGRCIDICIENAIQLIIIDDNFIKRTLANLEAKIDVT